MAYCKWLKDAAGSSSLIAVKLAKLMNAKQPVPHGFVITEKAFDDFVKHRKIDFSKPSDFVDTSLPGEMQAEIIEYYKYIDAADDLKHMKSAHALLSAASRDPPYATVRSDKKTFANVKGTVALARAIQECWSTSDGQPVEVVVTKQANPERSGLIIPKGKDLWIKASYGYEILSPDTYIYDAEEEKVLGIDMPGQTIQIVRDDYSPGVLRKEVPKEKQNTRILSNTELEYLAKLACDVSDAFGKPQEVHWQLEKYRIFITDVQDVSAQSTGGEKSLKEMAGQETPQSMQSSALEDSTKAHDEEEEPQPEPMPEPEPDGDGEDGDEEPEPEGFSADPAKLVLMLRLNTSGNFESLKQELDANKDKDIFVQAVEREQVLALQNFAAEHKNLKVLMPQYLLDLIVELNLDKNKFVAFEDKSL
ncbi:MAG TPA: PEP/pyruvate-binding domain-containing protein [Candidatus Nanoarchaeia archaeon]|nr:PEP/pyruvate-binding domain-containing protein [Candidatus Nanoarchaeia archaeon]